LFEHILNRCGPAVAVLAVAAHGLQNPAMHPSSDHEVLVRTARRISRGFARDLDSVAPLGPPSRRREPLAGYLARVVVGQQL
jgi:hypothetical protein